MKKLLLLFAGLAASWCATAGIVLPEIIGDHMILQQNSDANIWGWGDPGAAVKVSASWGAKAATRCDAAGRWQVSLPTPAASFEPQRITIRSGETVTLDDVLVGEVWFASGQSNMDMPLGGYWNALVEGANRTIAMADAQRDRVRFVKVVYAQSYTTADRAEGRWNPFTTATAPRMSAAAYYFAETLSQALDVPVGVIDASWGGSRIECWMPCDALAAYGDIDLSERCYEESELHMRPMAMYNAMVHPLTRYTLRGFLWYQGESNIGHHSDYHYRMADMAAAWRRAWGGGERMPFFFVEIAPYAYGHNLAAYLREAQYRAQREIPNSGMVPTNDLVEPYESANIHPARKREVGERLAFWALNRTYARPQVACEGMQLRSVEIAGGRAHLDFDFTEGGFGRLTDIRGFEVCGADRVFRPAQAAPESNTRMMVWSDEVPEPVAVRYGFGDFMPGTVVNGRGMPLIPFRTDDF